MAQDPNDPNVPQTAPPGTDPNAPPPAPPVPPKVTKSGKLAKGNNYFCLESTHGGTQRVDIHDMSRHFTNDTPNCPSCGRSVSALVVDDPTVLPPSIQLLKDRLAATEAR